MGLGGWGRGSLKCQPLTGSMPGRLREMQVPGSGVPLPLGTLPRPVGPPLAPCQAHSLLYFLPSPGPAGCPLPGAEGGAECSPGLVPQEGAPSTPPPRVLEPTAALAHAPGWSVLRAAGGVGTAGEAVTSLGLSSQCERGRVGPRALRPAKRGAIPFHPQTQDGQPRPGPLFHRQETEDRRAQVTRLRSRSWSEAEPGLEAGSLAPGPALGTLPPCSSQAHGGGGRVHCLEGKPAHALRLGSLPCT